MVEPNFVSYKKTLTSLQQVPFYRVISTAKESTNKFMSIFFIQNVPLRKWISLVRKGLARVKLNFSEADKISYHIFCWTTTYIEIMLFNKIDINHANKYKFMQHDIKTLDQIQMILLLLLYVINSNTKSTMHKPLLKFLLIDGWKQFC